MELKDKAYTADIVSIVCRVIGLYLAIVFAKDTEYISLMIWFLIRSGMFLKDKALSYRLDAIANGEDYK